MVKKVFLSREAILASALPFEDVEIPEWGGVVRIQAMDAQTGTAYLEKTKDVKEDDISTLLVTFCAVDDNGKLLFTPDDLPMLNEKQMDPVNKLAQAAIRVNNMGKDTPKK